MAVYGVFKPTDNHGKTMTMDEIREKLDLVEIEVAEFYRCNCILNVFFKATFKWGGAILHESVDEIREELDLV